MARVYTRCPRTGRAVPTQLVIDPETFRIIRAPPFTYACAACGQLHVWTKETAWCGEPAPPGPGRDQ